MAKDYVTYPAVAERLNIVDNAIHTPPVQLSDDILSTASDGVGVGIVAVLLGERAARVWHGELVLYFVEDYPGTVELNERVKTAGKYRRHADIGNAEEVIGVRLSAFDLSQQHAQTVLVLDRKSVV
jgi:hypothetical protein